MQDYYHKPFSHFSPLDGRVPEYHNSEFDYIATKARAILNGRSLKEIEFGMQTVNWIMSRAELEYSPIINSNNFIELEVEEGTPDIELVPLILEAQKNQKPEPERPRFYYSPATQLLNSIGKYDISNQYDMPNAIQAEYFALLALALINVACVTIDDPYKELDFPATHEELETLNYINTLVINSMEAVSFAKILYLNKNGESSEKKAQKLISLKNSAAAIKRHEPGNELKVKFLKFYQSSEFPSLAEGVRRFYDTLSSKEKSLLHNDEGVRDRFFRQAHKDFKSGNIEI